MHWIDYLIVIIPLLAVIWFAIYSKKYVRGVVDYLAVGRVAGRYVLTVGDMTAGLGVITLVAMVEANYQTGFALNFWNSIMAPVAVLMSLTGYCMYRFRETKALSNGQFLEMRYSRSFRIFASFLRILAEMLTNAIGPAIAANFFIYFLGLPHTFDLWGMTIPTFAVVVAIVLLLAMIIILPGGRISLVITDSLQGLISYPFFVIISIYIMFTFSWDSEIMPAMADRVPGESFLNPFDIGKLRDFNLFAVIVTVFSSLLNRAAYAGNDSSCAGRTPHEQKMAGILSAWRSGFSGVMCMFVAIAIITVMTHQSYAPQAHQIRQELSAKVAGEAIPAGDLRQKVTENIAKIPMQTHVIGVDSPLSQAQNLDTIYMDTAQKSLGNGAEENLIFQKFRTMYNQMMMPMGLKRMLPIGLLGSFCLLMIMLMVSTDDSRIFNAASAIIQDLVVPLRKTPLTPQQHLRLIKWCSVFVALFFFCGSLFFAQLDYINMFLVIMVSIWLGGAGPVIVFGLYSRFGNTIGAYSAVIVGSGITVAGIFLQRNWADSIYPFIMNQGWEAAVGNLFNAVNDLLDPLIVWKMDSVKCPINSYEIYFIAMIAGIVAYVAGSLLTYRKPYNLDRMLHRGIYNTDHDKEEESPWSLRTIWSKLIGITPEYTRGDKAIAWSVFIWTFVYQIGFCFFAVLIWQNFSPWPIKWWGDYTYVTAFVISPIVGVITTVWFLWGGIVDTKRLFNDLAKRVDNPLDNGAVEGHVSLADKALFGNDKDEG